MKVTKTKLDGLLVLEPKVLEDDRGYFFESWNKEIFNRAIGRDVTFVQDNQSFSRKAFSGVFILNRRHLNKPSLCGFCGAKRLMSQWIFAPIHRHLRSGLGST